MENISCVKKKCDIYQNFFEFEYWKYGKILKSDEAKNQTPKTYEKLIIQIFSL